MRKSIFILLLFISLNNCFAQIESNTIADFQTAKQKVDKGNFEDAIKIIDNLISKSPDSLGYVFYRAVVHTYMGKKKETIEDYTMCIDKNYEKYNCLFYRALIKSSLNDREGAIKDYNEIIENEKNIGEHVQFLMGTVYNNKGYCLFELGNIDEALKLVNKAIQLAPNESYIWGSRGEIYFKKEKYLLCINDMQKSVDLISENKSKYGASESNIGFEYYFIGQSNIKLGNNKSGCEFLQKSDDLGYRDASTSLCKFCNQPQKRRVIRFYDRENNLLKDSANADIQAEITYNKGQNGSLKLWISGQYSYSGNFLSLDESNLTSRIENGKCIWFYPNGMKKRVGTFANGKETGTATWYDRQGRISSTMPFKNGVADTLNSLTYIYFHNGDGYAIFKGSMDSASNFDGTITHYTKAGDTIISFPHGVPNDGGFWAVEKPHEKDKKWHAEFADYFKYNEPSSDWIKRDKLGVQNYNILNNKLHIEYTNTDTRQWGAFYLANPVSSLDKVDFKIVTEFSKESTSESQGILFGAPNMGSFHRASIFFLKNKNKFIYEHFENGNFVNDTDFTVSGFKENQDNEFSVEKIGNEVNFYVNGWKIGGLSNLNIQGSIVGLGAWGNKDHNNALFNMFDMKIFPAGNVKKNTVPVKTTDGVYTINVQLNGVLMIDFIFDPGASDVSISPDVALTLIRTGTIKEEDWLSGGYYRFADGSTAKSKRFVLRSLKIGDRVVNNVNCSISNSIEAPMLLGQSVLSRFGKYTFDNQKKTIVIE